MTDLIFYTHPQSRGCTVRWMLEECGAHYETRLLQWGTSMKAPDYLKINPLGKVPSIVDKGHVVTEQSAIVTYLADLYPEKQLAPQNRASYYRWLFFLAGPFEAALMDKAMHVEHPQQAQISLGYGSFERSVHMLEDWLKNHPFIAADHFTAADLYATAALDFAKKRGLLQNAVFDTYCTPHLERNAHQRAQALDAAALEGMEKQEQEK